MKGTDRRSGSNTGRDKQRDRRLVGETVAGKYKVLDVLGQGGFGTVFLVEMTSGIVGDRLAMKILPREFSQNDMFRDQFLNEIRVAMKMVDKQIVQIRDVGVFEDDDGESGGLLYYTMDYIEGKSLAQILAESGSLTVPRTLRLVRRILPALRTAHSAGIIHRDLKPANIMVETDEDGKDQVRMLDFGIATAIDADGGAAPEEPEPIVTGKPGPRKSKGFAGSPYYMPPEQFKGREMGFYTDLYSVGVILYECITGQKPYRGNSPQEIYNAIKKGPPPSIDELSPDVEAFPGLTKLVMKALERNPEKRFQTAKEIYDDLSLVISGLAEPKPVSPSGAAGGFRAGGRRRSASSREPASPAVRRDTMRRKVGQERPRSSNTVLIVLVVTVLTAVGAIGAAFVFKDEIRGTADLKRKDSTSTEKSDVVSRATETPDTELTGPDPGSTPLAHAGDDAPTPREGDEGGEDAETAAERIKEGQRWIRAKIEELSKQGHAAVAKNDLTTAAERAEEILQLREKHVEGLLLHGIILVEQKKYIEARRFLEQVFDASSKDDKTRLLASVYLGEVYMRLPKPEWNDAQVYLKSVLDRAPKNVRALTLLAELYETQGETSELETLVQHAHDLGIEEKRLASLWRKIFVEGPKRARAKADSAAADAKTAFAARDWAKAARLAKRAIEARPSIELAELAMDAGFQLEDSDHIRYALVALRKLVEADLNAQSDPGWEARLTYYDGRLAYFQLLETGDRNAQLDAEFHLDKAIKLTSRKKQEDVFCWAHTYVGLLRARDGELGPVVAHFKPTLGFDDPEIMYEQAKTYMNLAKNTRKKAVKLEAHELAKRRLLNLSKIVKPKSLLKAKMESRLGECYLKIGAVSKDKKELQASRKHFRLAASDKRLDTAETHDLIALTYIHAEIWIRAAQSYRDAYNRKPTPKRCLAAVNLFIRSNSRSPARELLSRAIKDHPTNRELRAKLLEMDGE